MRPLTLSIRGVNSFVQEETVDFTALTRHGFFGIFGETGSGKSTILDGITLALYGKVARGGNNFINTGVARAQVVFRFALSGHTRKVYRVRRSFKRDAALGTAQTDKCELYEESDADTPLAENVREINDRLREIVGLSYDDFTRTIVLPQGSFSDFLMLGGRARGEMLERLFRLDRYGKELTAKLARRFAREKEAFDRLEGELAGYGEISAALVSEGETAYREAVGARGVAAAALEAARADEEEKARVWALQTRRDALLEQARELSAQRPQRIADGEKARSARRAAAVAPTAERAKEDEREAAAAEAALTEALAAFEACKAESAAAQAAFDAANAAFEREDGPLREGIRAADEALELARRRERLDKDASETRKAMDKWSRLQTDANALCASLAGEIAALDREIATCVSESEALFTPNERREAIRLGLAAQGEAARAGEALETARADYRARKALAQTCGAEAEAAAAVLTQVQNKLGAAEAALNALRAHPPADQKQMSAQYEALTVRKTQRARLTELRAALDKARTDDEAARRALEKARAAEEETRARAAALRKEVTARERGNMARALRAALEKGDCCPVCGQKVHDLPHDDAPASARDLDGELRLAEAALAGYAGETARLEAAAGRAQAEARDAAAACAPLEAALAGHDPDAEDARYREKQAALAAYQEKLTADEAALRALSESAAAARARLSGCEARRALAETELARAEAAGKSAKALWEEKRAQLAAACAQAGVTSFEEADRALRENDRLRAEADARRVEREQTRAQRTLKREAALAQSHRAETEVAALTANLTALNRQIEGLDGDIRARVGGETDISGYKARLTAAHEKIVSDRRRAEEARACAQEKCNSANLRAESAKGQLQTRRSALALSRTRLDAALRENRFENAEAALAAQLPPGEIDALEEAVAAHERLALLNAQQTEETEQALSGRSLTREDWEAAKSLTQTSEAELRAWEAEETRRESRWKTLAGTWEKAEAAQKKHAARGHTLALLDELKRVLAGNRFVQYAAAERMSVLAQSAGQTLLDITRGGYSLISDDKGAFWVVDNKNGGVRRPPATLSGGETFLASLALALSLSAQIQMTNDAPLELFFLDEGFGTLDESLLGEVFDALEKLPNPARAIGLISHVEEIKNRVPVKLVVKAATGGQGSQVNIEWT